MLSRRNVGVCLTLSAAGKLKNGVLRPWWLQWVKFLETLLGVRNDEVSLWLVTISIGREVIGEGARGPLEAETSAARRGTPPRSGNQTLGIG